MRDEKMKKAASWTCAVLVVVFAGVTTGCNRVSPCVQLPPPNAAQIGAANSGAEVEFEVKGVECVVQGNTWVETYD